MTRLVATALVLASSSAFADIDNDKADRLFKEALELRSINPTQACAKFAEALTYNPQAIGTHLNVAKCDEDQGKLASAAAKYREIIDRAVVQKLADFQKEAEERLAAIKDQVPYLTISFSTAPPEGVRVVVDDKLVTVTGKTRVAIDPGERKIVVTAPGRVTYVTTVIVAKKDDKAVELPGLAKASSTRRTVGKLAVISGGALFGASIGVALVARSRYQKAKRACQNDSANDVGATLVCMDASDLSDLQSAQTLGDVGTVVGIVGLASAAVGGVLWWRSSATESRTGITRIDVTGGDTVGVALHGRF